MKPLRILFVCAGNICRSPLAEGVFAKVATDAGRADAFEIDSAGTGGWHQGDPPDPRSVATARSHGIDISRQKARRVASRDFDRFDLILAMDRDNLRDLKRLRPAASSTEIHLFLDYARGMAADIPDPYYGEDDGFETVYNMLFDGCTLLMAKL